MVEMVETVNQEHQEVQDCQEGMEWMEHKGYKDHKVLLDQLDHLMVTLVAQYIQDGGTAGAQTSLEMSWSTQEELGGASMQRLVVELTISACQKIPNTHCHLELEWMDKAMFKELSTKNLYKTIKVLCAVCHVTTREVVLMIPAKTSCPSSWTREYYGYLMSAHRNHQRSMYECVDKEQESVPETAAATDGALFYLAEADCATGLPCPPYNTEQELNCVVCTK